MEIKVKVISLMLLLALIGIIFGGRQSSVACPSKDIVQTDTVLVALDQWGFEVGLAERSIFSDSSELIQPPYVEGKLQKCPSFRKDIWLYDGLFEKVVKPYLISKEGIIIVKRNEETKVFRIKKGS